jgi:hypothetical protein
MHSLMTDLIVIIGPPAAGKAAVGHELAKVTGFRFFHNHMTAEPVAALFGWGTDRFREAFGRATLVVTWKSVCRTRCFAHHLYVRLVL